MKSRVYFPYDFSILRFLIACYVKKLFVIAAAAAEAEDLDQRLRQIKAVRYVPGQPFEIDELTLDVLH